MPEPNGSQGFIPPHGGFADLISYQKSAILLDQQIRRLEQDFIRHGGIRERMARARRR